MKLYIRKKPLIVKAIRFDGTNREEIEAATEGEYYIDNMGGGRYTFSYHTVRDGPLPTPIEIGDFVIQGGVNGWYLQTKAKFEAIYVEYRPNTDGNHNDNPELIKGVENE